ncbi:uncharacterized protein MKS88_000223 [Plasmodium brasilianum]|uniref:uncharacterized protein n=1 Tax=Plasmodium brasilianum TaxID=5824 RepID=UPI00350E3ED0|nr:hypothetical protein MKS88_000223 [Plasmodium brasilianum]
MKTYLFNKIQVYASYEEYKEFCYEEKVSYVIYYCNDIKDEDENFKKIFKKRLRKNLNTRRNNNREISFINNLSDVENVINLNNLRNSTCWFNSDFIFKTYKEVNHLHDYFKNYCFMKSKISAVKHEEKVYLPVNYSY